MLGVEILGIFHTIAYATNHTLELAAQTGEISSKDHNDRSVGVEITGMSWSINTDNLVEDDASLVACGYSSLKSLMLSGQPFRVHLRYYDASIGTDSLKDNNDWCQKVDDAQAVISGEAIMTSLNLNAGNKQNATYSATFTGKGEFIIGE